MNNQQQWSENLARQFAVEPDDFLSIFLFSFLFLFHALFCCLFVSTARNHVTIANLFILLMLLQKTGKKRKENDLEQSSTLPSHHFAFIQP